MPAVGRRRSSFNLHLLLKASPHIRIDMQRWVVFMVNMSAQFCREFLHWPCNLYVIVLFCFLFVSCLLYDFYYCSSFVVAFCLLRDVVVVAVVVVILDVFSATRNAPEAATAPGSPKNAKG